MHPCVWFYCFPIASFLVPVILCIYNYEGFKAPLSAGTGEAFCSAEIADKTFSVRSKIQCAILCNRNAFCMEFNFRMDTKSCEFYYCRASHVLGTTLHCSNYQSQKLLSGNYGNGCVDRLVLPENCSFPFTYSGNRFLSCTQNLTSTTHEYGCYNDQYKWRSCGLPADYVVIEIAKNISIPNFPGVSTVMSVNNWITFHHRSAENLNYNRSWAVYKAGFGVWSSDYWLGLEKLYRMTSQGTWRLRIEMKELSSGDWVSTEYDNFKVDTEGLDYALHVSTYWYGNLNSIITGQNGAKFSTRDRDNDGWSPGACSLVDNQGGFWYNTCFVFCLTCVRSSTYAYKLADYTLIEIGRSNMMMRQL